MMKCLEPSARIVARIVIQIGGHLCTAPRPQKEAAALSEAGHDVLVIGVWFHDSLVNRDKRLLRDVAYKFKPAVDPGGGSIGSCLAAVRSKIGSRRARSRFIRKGVFSPRLLGMAAPELMGAVRKNDFDLLIVHSEAGLWIGNELLKRGQRVGVDFEDWFSRDLPKSSRSGRPVKKLEEFESTLAQRCTYRLATSRAMADSIAAAYRVDPPETVPNSFDFAERFDLDGERKDRTDLNRPSLHWFSQTIGPGRGIEVLMEALGRTTRDVQVHLRGDLPDRYSEWLHKLIPVSRREQVFVHSQVANTELLSRIAEHDIGLAIETNQIENRDVTTTNKVYQYLLGGLAVIATDTRGQREVFESNPDAGVLIPCDDSTALAQSIDELAGNPERVIAMKKCAIEAARRYDWNIVKPRLVALAEKALKVPA